MMNSRLMLVMAIVVSAAFSRLIPHAPNLTPMTAVALFAGAYIADRKLALLVPLAALLLSDALLGFYGPGEMLAVYFSTALTAALGIWVKKNRAFLRVGSAAIAGSVLFFVLTNFSVWAFRTMYPKTGAGLIACYVAALPFFRNTLIGDLLYTAVLFGGFAVLARKLPVLQEHAAPVR
jgi:uncharacterized protein DUF6580